MADARKVMAEADCSYVIINNIPNTFHSADLRNFFSQFIEIKGFDCFHFRHRPEVQTQSQNDKTQTSSSSSQFTCVDVKKITCCCIAKVKSNKINDLIRMYNKKHWIDKTGSIMPQKCFICKIKVADESEPKEKQYQTRLEQRQIPCDRQTFTKSNLISLPELHPPDVMPNGNVGTPTEVFLNLIKECRLPVKVISNLKLNFPKSAAKRKYSCVSYDYGQKLTSSSLSSEPEDVLTASGHEITDIYIEREENQDEHHEKDDRLNSPQSSEESDDDECEEWDRHEALHNDVTQQERSKERLYEEEIELQWEKGGSGLVFYTDAQYWDQENGDFDERTADDWDVDMSIYYEKGAGDKDAKDFIQMRREKQLRDGSRQESVFKSKIGKFETHTKGIGRKLLEKYGWRDGEGIGKSKIGISEALENDGQNPYDKKGFGYHGEKLNRFPVKKRRKSNGVFIGTIYDKPEDLETPESLLRSQEPFVLKYIK